MLALVERLNLSPLQGRAADALRAVQGTFPPALRGAASAAESLQAAASSWANQLSGFQAEADALERQAAAATAQQQALQARAATLPRGAVVLTDDLQTASAAVSGIHGQAQELHQRYLAAAGKQPRTSARTRACGIGRSRSGRSWSLLWRRSTSWPLITGLTSSGKSPEYPPKGSGKSMSRSRWSRRSGRRGSQPSMRYSKPQALSNRPAPRKTRGTRTRRPGSRPRQVHSRRSRCFPAA